MRFPAIIPEKRNDRNLNLDWSADALIRALLIEPNARMRASALQSKMGIAGRATCRLDGLGRQWQGCSMIAVEEAVGRLRSLSPERSERVLALIEDLADLQALEDKQDVEDARTALAEPGEDIPLEALAKELGV